MYDRMLKAFSGTTRGRVVLGIWAATLAGVSFKALLTRGGRKKGRKGNEKKGRKKSKLRKLLRKAMTGKSRTVPWLVLLSVAIGAKVVVGVKVSEQIGHLGKLVATRDWDAMFASQISFALWCMPAAAVAAATGLAESRLALAFRSNLTDAIHAEYEAAQTMLPAAQQLDHPDQRVTADVDQLCGTLAKLYTGLARPLVEVLFVSGTLAHHMGWKELLKCYSWFMVSGFWIRWVGPSFKSLTGRVASEEAAFRSSHKRIVDYAEEIEMLRGANAEAGIVRRAYERVRAVKSWFQFQTAVSDCLSTYTLRYMGILVAYATMLPAVYYGTAQATVTAHVDPTEYTLTCLHLLVNVGLAARDLMLGARTYSVASALATRVDEVSSALTVEPLGSPANRVTTEDVVEFTGVTINTPSGECLVRDLTFRAGRHEHVFVHGPNGAGKTTLFRVMCGIVTPAAGRVAIPARSACFYVPQRAYLIPGTLREQLCYPNVAGVQDGGPARDFSDNHLLEVLAMVGLEQLASTPEDLNSTSACDGLSAGEQQRVGIARLLLHQPTFAMLDECTNSLDEAFEAWVYEHCASLGITLFTVSHRLSLRRHHKHELHLVGDGTAQFTTKA